MSKLVTAITAGYLLFIITQFGDTEANGKEFCFNDTISCYIREGDTIIFRVNFGEVSAEKSSEVRKKRHAIRPYKNLSNIWKDGVNYYFDYTVTMGTNGKGQNQKLMKEFAYAVKAWEQDTCVNFKKVDPPASYGIKEKRDVLRITADEPGCSSHPGKLGGEQPLILGEGCENFGHIAHELGHALGLYHTMARHDRDEYVDVKTETMEEEYHVELKKQSEDDNENFGIGYDYGSIMHYPSKNLFSKGKPSIIPKDEKYSSTMGSEMISFVDLWMINKLYSCEDECIGKEKINCKHGGFPHPRNCSRCLCPGGYGGDDCTIRPNDGCGEELKAEKSWEEKVIMIQNHNPKDYLDGYRKCNYWIRSPTNTKIQVEFYAGYFEDEPSGCVKAGVEIKTNRNQTLTGYRLCSDDADGWRFTSYTNLVPVIAYSREFLASVATIKYRYLGEGEDENSR